MTGLLIAVFAAYALLCAAVCATAACVAAVADMTRRARPVPDWRRALSEHSRAVPRDRRGRFASPAQMLVGELGDLFAAERTSLFGTTPTQAPEFGSPFYADSDPPEYEPPEERYGYGEEASDV